MRESNKLRESGVKNQVGEGKLYLNYRVHAFHAKLRGLIPRFFKKVQGKAWNLKSWKATASQCRAGVGNNGPCMNPYPFLWGQDPSKKVFFLKKIKTSIAVMEVYRAADSPLKQSTQPGYH